MFLRHRYGMMSIWFLNPLKEGRKNKLDILKFFNNILMNGLVAVFLIGIIVGIIIYYGIDYGIVKTNFEKLKIFSNNIVDEDTIKTARIIFLNDLNKERKKFNLPIINFSNHSIAQFKAEDMINRSYFGHVSPPGIMNLSYHVPPNLLYTYLGGMYYIEENIMHEDCPENSNCIDDPLEGIKRYAYIFIYEDEQSNWGHRDSLLNPCHNKVGIGFSYNSQKIRFVVHMSGEWIKWIKKPRYVNGIFEAAGIINMRFKINPSNSIFIYFVPFQEVPKMKNSYKIGELIAGVTLKGFRYEEIETIYPEKFLYNEENGRFYVKFKYLPKNKGIYTITLFGEDLKKIPHPYKRDWEFKCPLFMYSFANIP